MRRGIYDLSLREGDIFDILVLVMMSLPVIVYILCDIFDIVVQDRERLVRCIVCLYCYSLYTIQCDIIDILVQDR